MNYILKYTGVGLPDADAVKKILNANDITILDNSNFPKMTLLGNVTDNAQQIIKTQLPGTWELFPQQEQKFRVPDTRFKIGKK